MKTGQCAAILALVVILAFFGGRAVFAQPATGGPAQQQLVVPIAPAGTPAYGQVAVTTALTLIRSANANRTTITLVNHGTTNVFIGFTNGLTAANGAMLAGVPGQVLVISTRSDIYGIASGGTQIVGYMEETR